MKQVHIRKSLLYVLIFISFYAVFHATSIKTPTYFDHFIRLSEQLMQGKIEIENPPEYLELSLDDRTGKRFVAYPPMPAVVLMPFVKLNIFEKSQTDYSILFGALDCLLFYIFTSRFFNSQKTGGLLTLSLGLGTSFWYLASDGSSWYISHVLAIFFLIAAMLLLELQELNDSLQYSHSVYRWFFSGCALACAYMTRDPTIIAGVFFLSLPYIKKQHELKQSRYSIKNFINITWQSRRQLLAFLIPLAASLIIIAGYNYARFGTIRPVQHEKIPHLLELAIFNKGFLNIEYIPRNLAFFFTKMPLRYEHFPYYKPSLEGMSYILVSPFIIFIIFAAWRKLWVKVAFLTAVCMLIPPLMNGSNGFSQFGYRYAMEATIFFLLLFGTFLQKKKWFLALPFIFLAIAINYWGIYFIRVLQISGW